MRAEVIEQFGGPEVFKEQDAPIREPRSHEVLVRVLATSVNPVDAKIRHRGGFGVAPPAILGYDVSGVIEAVGDAVTGFRSGDEVFYSPGIDSHGSYAEYHVADARIIAHKPTRLSHEEAATLPLAGSTALQALLDRGQLRAGDRVLIHGDGGVGVLAGQIARAAGADVSVVGSDYMQETLLELGVDRVLSYQSGVVVETLRDELGEGCMDVVIDTVGGDSLEGSLPLVAQCGRMVTIVEDCRGTFGPAIARNARLDLLLFHRSGPTLDRLARLVDRGEITPIIDSVMPLDQVAEAHRRLEEGGVRGKIVLVPSIH